MNFNFQQKKQNLCHLIHIMQSNCYLIISCLYVMVMDKRMQFIYDEITDCWIYHVTKSIWIYLYQIFCITYLHFAAITAIKFIAHKMQMLASSFKTKYKSRTQEEHL